MKKSNIEFKSKNLKLCVEHLLKTKGYVIDQDLYNCYDCDKEINFTTINNYIYKIKKELRKVENETTKN